METHEERQAALEALAVSVGDAIIKGAPDGWTAKRDQKYIRISRAGTKQNPKDICFDGVATVMFDGPVLSRNAPSKVTLTFNGYIPGVVGRRNYKLEQGCAPKLWKAVRERWEIEEGRRASDRNYKASVAAFKKVFEAEVRGLKIDAFLAPTEEDGRFKVGNLEHDSATVKLEVAGRSLRLQGQRKAGGEPMLWHLGNWFGDHGRGYEAIRDLKPNQLLAILEVLKTP